MMLFEASPLSISSFRLMVIVLFKRGGSTGAGEFAEVFRTAAAEDAGTVFCAGEVLEGEAASEAEAAAGARSAGPIAGGSDVSAGGSWAGRFTITVSPASLATPPASAKTSRRVTGRSAWTTMACPTAPTTVMGLLFRSLTDRKSVV